MARRAQTEFVALAALAGSTLRQLLRDPAMILVFIGALVLIIGAPTYAVFHFDELAKVIIDTGLSTVLVAGLLLALLGPARAVAYELEDRTALTLLSKPIGRLTVVCGKYGGVLAAAAAVMLPLTIAVLYVTRIEEATSDWEELMIGSPEARGLPLRVWALYAFGLGAPAAGVLAALLRPRGRLATGYWAAMSVALIGMAAVGPAAAWRWGVVGAAALIAMEVAVVAAVSLAAAVRLGPLGTMGVGLTLVIGGHLRPLADSGGGGWGGSALLAWLPGLEALNALEAAAAGAPVPALYVAWAGLYATMYAAAALLVGAALVHGREVA